MLVVQSQHPYEAPPDTDTYYANYYYYYEYTDKYTYTILNQAVNVPGTAEFVVYFDKLTSLKDIDNVAIYSSENKTNLLFKFTSLFPGKTQPSIVIPGPSFYVEFSGDEYALAPLRIGSTTYAENFYGFTMYIYPVMAPALGSRLTVFDSNEAGVRGGAVREKHGVSGCLYVCVSVCLEYVHIIAFFLSISSHSL